MSRDHQSWAARIVWTTGGPKSNTTNNTLYFKYTGGIAPTPTEMSGIADTAFKFFNGAAGGTGTITYFMGPQVKRGSNQALVDLYDLDLADPRHHFGSPVATYQKSPGAGFSSVPFPNECAVVLSYRASYGSDPEHDGVTRPRASDRGRTYIGPLSQAASTTAVLPNGTSVAVVEPNLMSAAMTAASTIVTAAPTSNFLWCVWSRKEAQLKPVAYKACDNSFDTLRRREVEPPGLEGWVPV